MTKEKKYNYTYITTNLINGKQYIGDHSTNNLDDGYLGSGTTINKAIKKYNKVNFRKEILKICETKQEAFDAQEKYINKYNTLSPNGYNISPKGGYGMSGSHLNEETIEKIKKSLSGRTLSKEHKEQIRKSHLGKTLTHETKQKIGEKNKIALKGRILSSETRLNISISLKGKNTSPKSEETKEKNRQWHLGRGDTEETRKRKSAAAKARWKNKQLS